MALIATIVLLTAYSYLAGVRSGVGTRGRVASAAVGAGIGILVAVLKVAPALSGQMAEDEPRSDRSQARRPVDIEELLPDANGCHVAAGFAALPN